ncbi:virulence-associated V antigen [Aeromonas schubertii]|uniref:virulence-associated V antigen n=1 Tax=Aeromonas schubertii TaxID=652 RepID=UPI0010A83802|nr:virulence-associated V antigen [Aeromonas schubertii]QCG47956.1 virulence factor [Aeromonas schubertii]
MQIRSYNDNPQGFLDDLGTVNLDQLTGSHSSALDPLLAFIKEKGIQISASGSSPFINEELLKKMLAYFMPEDAIVKGGHLDRQIRGGIEHLKELLTSAVAGSPTAAAKTTWSLQEFMALAHFSLTGDRVDDDIIAVMAGTMKNHSDKRDKLKDEVGALTAELRIYAVIQAEINNKLSATPRSGSDLSALVFTNTIFINDRGLNLMDYHLYGYPNQDAFEKSEEYDLLIGITSDKNKLTIKAFLESGSKSSGSMSGLSDTYAYDKDNNKLGNFATTVGDKSRPLNDKVSQKTTELNDISSRYNSAIEALNRFIQKYESMMQQILQAI